MPDDKSADQPEPLQVPLLQYAEWYRYPVGLQQELEKVIREGQSVRRKDQFPKEGIAQSRWAELGQILASYLEGQRLNDVVLHKDDRKQLKAIAGTARKLFNLIEKAVAIDDENMPLRDKRTALFFCTWLDDRTNDADPFLDTLSALADLDPKRNIKHSSSWITNEDIARRAAYQGMFLSHRTRAGLQQALGEWWRGTTGLAISYADGEKTPYTTFLEMLYAPMVVSNVPGASATAVKNANRNSQHEAMDRELLRQNLAAFRDHLKTRD